MGELLAKLRARFSRANSSSAASVASASDGENSHSNSGHKTPSTSIPAPAAATPLKAENSEKWPANSAASAHGNCGTAWQGPASPVSRDPSPGSPREKLRAGNGAVTPPRQVINGAVSGDDGRRNSTVSTTLESIHENEATLTLTSARQHDRDSSAEGHDVGGPLDGPPSTPAALATGDRGATATATSPITYTDPFQRAIPDTSSPTNILKSPLAVKSAVGSLGRGAAGGSGGGPRRQSLIPRSQVPHIKNYLSLGSANDESGCEFDLLSDASQLATRMAPRKIWVKRPGGSPTMVTVGEDDVVDDVRDLILRKYGNSLGRQFDAPDLTIRIVPRDQRQERQLGPEEPMVRTLDAYYPGGQSIDEALIIDVPLRRTTPKASPRNGPPNSTYYAAADDGRPSESAGDYFGPGALGVPSMHHHMLQQQPSAMAMVQSGHIPQIPSPGGSRSSRHYKDRPERPRLGRQHTSSPTILGVGGAGGPATGVIGGVATTAAAGVGLTGGVVAPGASYGRDFPATHQHLSHHSHSNQNNNQHTPPPINTRPRSRAHSNSSDHSQTGAALGNVGPSTPSGMVSSAVGPQQFVAATVGGGGGGASDKAAGSPASVVLLPAAGGGGGPSAATGPSGVRGEGSPASVVATAGGGGGAPSSHRSGDTPPGRVSSPRPGSRAGLAAAGGGVSNGADGGSSNGNVPGPSSRTRRLRRAATTAGGDGHGHAAAGGATTATTKLQIGVPPINVLIVEDNIINLKLLEAFMKRLKVRWQTAMNGRDAVQRWKQGGFHLVLMDIQLPIMSGLEATREIRRLERANGIGVFSSTPSSSPGGGLDADGPQKDAAGSKLQNIDMFKSPVIIVALTASSLQSDRHEALAAGCNDFLTKPVNFVYLARKVMEWGCMQALIDFDGWRKWKSMTGRPDDDDAGDSKSGGKGGSGGKKGKSTGGASKTTTAVSGTGSGANTSTGTDTNGGDATASSSTSATGAPTTAKSKTSKKNRASLSLATSPATADSAAPGNATAAASANDAAAPTAQQRVVDNPA